MAKIAQATAPAIANVATARMTGTAVAGSGRVEELSAGNALSFEAAQFGFEGTPDNDLDQGQTLPEERRRRPNLGRGRFAAPNETFAAIVESEIAATGAGGRDEDGRAKMFAGLVGKAIATYELNAQVIHGTLPRLGASLSMRL